MRKRQMQQPIAMIHLSDMSFAQSISGKYGWRIDPSVKRSSMQHIEQGKGQSKAAITAPAIHITKVFRPLHIKLIMNHYVLNQVVQYKQLPLLSEPIKQQYEERMEQSKWQQPTDGMLKKATLLIQEQQTQLQHQRLQMLLSKKTSVKTEHNSTETLSQAATHEAEIVTIAQRLEQRPKALSLQLLKNLPQQHSKLPQAKAMMKLSSYIRELEASEARQQAEARKRVTLHIEQAAAKQVDTSLIDSKPNYSEATTMNHVERVINNRLQAEVKQQSSVRKLVSNYVSLHQQSTLWKHNEQQHLVIPITKKIQLTALIHEKIRQKKSILVQEKHLVLQGNTPLASQVKPMERQQALINKASNKVKQADTISTKLKYYLKAATIHTSMLKALKHISQTEHKRLIYTSSLSLHSQNINKNIKLYYRTKETAVEKSLQHKSSIDSNTSIQPMTAAAAYISVIRQQIADQQPLQAAIKQKNSVILQQQEAKPEHVLLLKSKHTIKATREHIVHVTKLHQQLLKKHETLIYQVEMVEKQKTSRSKKTITVPEVKLTFRKQQESKLIKTQVNSLMRKVSLHSSLSINKEAIELEKRTINRTEKTIENESRSYNEQAVPVNVTRKIANLHYSVQSLKLEHGSPTASRFKNQSKQQEQITKVNQLERIVQRTVEVQQNAEQTIQQVVQQQKLEEAAQKNNEASKETAKKQPVNNQQQRQAVTTHIVQEQLMRKGLYKKIVNEQFENARQLQSTLTVRSLLQQGESANRLPASLKSLRTLNLVQRNQLQLIHHKTRELNTLPIMMKLSSQPSAQQVQQAKDQFIVEKLEQRSIKSLIYKDSNQFKLVSSIVRELTEAAKVTKQINGVNKANQAIHIQQAITATRTQSQLTLQSQLTIARHMTTSQQQLIKTAQHIQLHNEMTSKNNVIHHTDRVSSFAHLQQARQQTLGVSSPQQNGTKQQAGQRALVVSSPQRTGTEQRIGQRTLSVSSPQRNAVLEQANRPSLAVSVPQQRSGQLAAASRATTASTTSQSKLSMIHSASKQTSIQVKHIVEQARPVALHVAQKTQQQKSESAPAVVTQLEQSVRRLEQELQDTKENIKAPKWNIGQLTDQLYNQLSKKIRLEQHRNGR